MASRRRTTGACSHRSGCSSGWSVVSQGQTAGKIFTVEVRAVPVIERDQLAHRQYFSSRYTEGLEPCGDLVTGDVGHVSSPIAGNSTHRHSCPRRRWNLLPLLTQKVVHPPLDGTRCHHVVRAGIHGSASTDTTERRPQPRIALGPRVLDDPTAQLATAHRWNPLQRRRQLQHLPAHVVAPRLGWLQALVRRSQERIDHVADRHLSGLVESTGDATPSDPKLLPASRLFAVGQTLRKLLEHRRDPLAIASVARSWSQAKPREHPEHPLVVSTGFSAALKRPHQVEQRAVERGIPTLAFAEDPLQTAHKTLHFFDGDLLASLFAVDPCHDLARFIEPLAIARRRADLFVASAMSDRRAVVDPQVEGEREATLPVTDADIVLGRLLPDRFAGGELRLDVDAAHESLRTEIAEPSHLELPVAAVGVSEVVDENMANAGRVHAIEQGCDVTGGTLIAFGGAAPLHAARVAAKLGIDEIVVPAGAGVGSAIGFLRAPAAHESVRTWHQRIEDLRGDELGDLLRSMHDEASEVVQGAAPDVPTVASARAFMRYRGQGHEITVPLPLDELLAPDAGRPSDHVIRRTLESRFVESYRELYTRDIPGLEVEALTWLLTVRTVVPPSQWADGDPADVDLQDLGEATVIDPVSGREVAHRVIDRGAVGAHPVAGPLLVVEDQTTTVVPEGNDVCRVVGGHLVVRRNNASEKESR